MKSSTKTVSYIIPFLLLMGFWGIYEVSTLNKLDYEENHKAATGDSDCISLVDGGDMDNLLSELGQVFIVMPAKAAGTSFKDFTRQCMSSTSSTSYSELDNVLNSKEQMIQAFKSQMKIPSLIASHVYNSETICRMAKHATKETLFIYIYREETERMASAIKDMFSGCICLKQENLPAGVTVTEDKCVVNQAELADMIQMWGKRDDNEVSLSNTKLLTCETYNCVKDNRANLVFLNYKQASKLQKLLAKHHCPKVTHEVRSNVGSNKIPLSVALEDPNSSESTTLVSMADWLAAKIPLLELTFGLKEGASCQATTRAIEDNVLHSCPDKTLHFSGPNVEFPSF